MPIMNLHINYLKEKKYRMIYKIDIDGVLCTNTNGDYMSAIPYKPRIKYINKLYKNGNMIILETSRGSTTGINWKDKTEQQLKKWRVMYHKIIFDGTEYDVSIDDKSISIKKFFGESL